MCVSVRSLTRIYPHTCVSSLTWFWLYNGLSLLLHPIDSSAGHSFPSGRSCTYPYYVSALTSFTGPPIVLSTNITLTHLQDTFFGQVAHTSLASFSYSLYYYPIHSMHWYGIYAIWYHIWVYRASCLHSAIFPALERPGYVLLSLLSSYSGNASDTHTLSLSQQPACMAIIGLVLHSVYGIIEG